MESLTGDVYVCHERKLTLILNFSKLQIRLRLSHMTGEVIDEFVIIQFIRYTVVNWIVRTAVGYAEVFDDTGCFEIHILLEPETIPENFLEHARKALYKRGWHAVDENNLDFINRCENTKEN